MKLTLDQFTAVCPRLGRAKASQYLPHLNDALDEFDINTERRIEAWISQMAHESAEGTALIENMNYSAKRLLQVFPKYFRGNPGLATEIAHDPRRIANHVYGGRMGNRKGTNDGFDFRARTPFQLTGRENYRAAGRALGIDLEADPDAANRDDVMWRVAGHFWKSHGLNALADNGDVASFKAITKRINGGYNGLSDRLNYWARAKRVIDDREPDEPLALMAEADDEDDTPDPTPPISPDPAALASSDALAADAGGATRSSEAPPAPIPSTQPQPVASTMPPPPDGLPTGTAPEGGEPAKAGAALVGGRPEDPPVKATESLWKKLVAYLTTTGISFGLIKEGTEGMEPTARGWVIIGFTALASIAAIIVGLDHLLTKYSRSRPDMYNIR